MHTPERPTEEIQQKMLLELYKLMPCYICLLIAGVIAGGTFFTEALILISTTWVRIAVGWLGLSLLGGCGWIYLRAYRWTKYEIFILERELDIHKEKTQPAVYLLYDRVRHIGGNLYVLIFLSGILITLLLVSSLNDKYENSLFRALSDKVIQNSRSSADDSLLIRAQDLCHNMLAARPAIFGNATETSLIDKYVHPLSSDLITANGSCGSYSFVLGRLLQTMGYPIRFAQMRAGNIYGCHILLEARSSGGWIVLDPLYNLHFVRPDGKLASFDDVAAHWSWYHLQTPVDYDPHYQYEGVRYTNWQKIPFALPALKKVLGWFLNKESLEHFSLRVYFLRKYLIVKYISLFLLLLVFSKIALKIISPKTFTSYSPINYPPITDMLPAPGSAHPTQ